MDYTGKIDVLDLVIEVLKEHEKTLDEYLDKLAKLIQRLENLDENRLMQRFHDPL